MRRSNDDRDGGRGRGRGRGGRRDDRSSRGRGYSNTRPAAPEDGAVYVATVTELALDLPPQGVFASLKGRGRHDGQRCLLRAQRQPAVEALQVNDTMRVTCRPDKQNRLEGRLCPPRIGSAKEGSATPPSKPLLVLDLNGVLCDRGTYATRDGKKKSVNRPGAARFVRWCYERFEVGVWSCAKKDNMELGLFEGRDLVMCWDQHHSTSLWPRTSTVSPQKPLFLKEIDRLWACAFDAPRDAQPSIMNDWRRKVTASAPSTLTRYDAATTVLIDNHLEKFERNPLGSCVLVPTWTASEEGDASLALDGALCQALGALSEGDCGATGLKMAGGGTVPLTHPQPTDDDVRKVQAYVQAGCPDGPLHPSLEALANAPAPPPPSAAELKAKADAQALATPAPPAPPKSSLERLASTQRRGFDMNLARRFAELYCSSPSHRSSCPDWPPRKYLERRDSPGPRARPLKRRDLGMLRTQRWFATEKTDGERHWLWADAGGCRLLARDLSLHRSFPTVKGLEQDTILDGEFIREASGREFFVAFDAVRSCGEDVGALPNAPARLDAASKAFACLDGQLDGLNVIAKTYYGADFDVLRKTLETGVFTDGERTTECDGVVLAAYRDAHGYYDAACYKYKPRVTLDVRLRSAPRVGDIDASVQNGPQDVTVTTIAIDAKALKLLKSVKPPQKRDGDRKALGHIVECEYIDGLWRVQRVRTDKRKPNSLRTAWSVLESIADRTSVADLAGALSEAWSKDTTSLAAEAHYDKIQRERNSGKQLEAQMFKLRRLNNFVKALVLDACCVKRDAVSSTSCDTKTLLRELRKPGRAKKPEKRDRRPCAVLELGCGRGGDLGKWRKAVEVTKLVACDISTESLAEAEKRWSNDGPPTGAFVAGDLGDATLAAKIKGSVGQWSPWADVASCHFALHYACGSAERIDAFLDCVSTNVKAGGVLVATIIDWLALKNTIEGSGKIGDLCSVKCSDAMRTRLLQLPDANSRDAWGVEYKFTLGDAVVDCAEFVVHLPSLIARAEAKGLKCTLEARFDRFLDGERRNRGAAFADLAAAIGVRPKHGNDEQVTDDQFAVTSLYTVVAFARE